MTAKPNGARKRRLALQHGLCHWCDKPLVSLNCFPRPTHRKYE